jgi:hypothetical protein
VITDPPNHDGVVPMIAPRRLVIGGAEKEVLIGFPWNPSSGRQPAEGDHAAHARELDVHEDQRGGRSPATGTPSFTASTSIA